MGCILELLKLWGQCLIFHYQEEMKLLLRKQKVSDTISIIIQTLFIPDSIAFFFLKKKFLYKSQGFVLLFFTGIHLLSPQKSLSHSNCCQTLICKLSTDICPLLAWYLLSIFLQFVLFLHALFFFGGWWQWLLTGVVRNITRNEKVPQNNPSATLNSDERKKELFVL